MATRIQLLPGEAQLWRLLDRGQMFFCYYQTYLISPAGLLNDKEQLEKTLQSFLDPSPESLKRFQKSTYFNPRSQPAGLWANASRLIRKKNQKLIAQADWSAKRLLSLATSEPIQHPITVIWGSHDQIIGKESAKNWGDFSTSFEFHTLEECSHNLHRECRRKLLDALKLWSNHPALP